MKEIQSFDYPLEKCLEICKTYKIVNATAFLLERSGAIHEAMDLYLQVLKFLILSLC